MSQKPSPVFHSSARRGFFSFIENDPKRIVARKLAREIQVAFATRECDLQTKEGVVHVRPGDAIITGTSGEHWRVSRSHFADKYEPVPPTKAGEPGTYRSLPYRILALSMGESFEVVLSDGISRLRGKAGDWLVDYGDGSLGIVSPSIFATTYELIG